MGYVRINSCSVDIEAPSSAKNITKKLIQGAVGASVRAKNGKKTFRPLDELSISIADGERVAFIGHNGAGKTSFLKLVSGVYEPTEGVMEVQGKITSLINISLGIEGDLTGYENVILKYAYMGYRKADALNAMDEIVEFCDLGEFFYMPVRTYSAGMKARLSFAIATSVQPEILLMDEWIGAGDAAFREKATARINSIAERSGIIIFATHSAQVIERWATRLIWLEKGKVHMDGGVAEVLPAYQAAVKCMR